MRLLDVLFNETRTSRFDIFRIVPPDYWMVTPDLENTDPFDKRLTLRGAVLLRVAGRCAAPPPGVYRYRPAAVGRTGSGVAGAARAAVAGLVAPDAEEGAARPAVVVAAIATSAAAMLIEILSFRALLDVSDLLNLSGQRMAAIGAILIFATLLLVMQLPVVIEVMGLGVTHLRMALLRKMPRLWTAIPKAGRSPTWPIAATPCI